jgi:hypothetical protein
MVPMSAPIAALIPIAIRPPDHDACRGACGGHTTEARSQATEECEGKGRDHDAAGDACGGADQRDRQQGHDRPHRNGQG